MRIIIENLSEGEEEEIVIRANNLDEQLMKLIYNIKSGREKLTGFKDGSIKVIDPKSVYYFESVDNKVFAYCETEIYEVRLKLYELEERFKNTDFIRSSKSTIVNIAKIQKLIPVMGGRFEVLLKNGEKTVISRQYVPVLKKKLGIQTQEA